MRVSGDRTVTGSCCEYAGAMAAVLKTIARKMAGSLTISPRNVDAANTTRRSGALLVDPADDHLDFRHARTAVGAALQALADFSGRGRGAELARAGRDGIGAHPEARAHQRTLVRAFECAARHQAGASRRIELRLSEHARQPGAFGQRRPPVEVDAALEPVANEPGRAIDAPLRIAIFDPVDVGE